MTTRTLLVIGALTLAMPAVACLNDRDTTTLADEPGKFPNAVQVITGRFPRNPPLYYEMRIAHHRRPEAQPEPAAGIRRHRGGVRPIGPR